MPAQPKFTAFPEQYTHFQSPSDCQAAYERGWQGCIPNPEAVERFKSFCRDTSGYVLRRGSWRTTAAPESIFMFAKTAR